MTFHRKLVLACFLTACRTPDGAATLDDTTPAITAPFAEGDDGELHWALRLNRMQCSHPGKARSWCNDADRPAAIAASGIEDTLLGWVRDPAVTAVKITYMTFSSTRIAQALCDASAARGLQVDVFLQKTYLDPPEAATGSYRKLLDCAAASPAALRVHARGGSQWLNHAKIFLAERDGRVRFTSSSANISSSGLSLHYDNWLVFDAPAAHRLARQNLCYFDALKNMLNAQGVPDKGRFMTLWKTCSDQIPADAPDGATRTRFIGVPAAPGMERPLDTLLAMIDGAQQSIRIAAHKITLTAAAPIATHIAAKAQQGIPVQIVFDDDTILKALSLPGAAALNVSAEELLGYQTLADAGAEITFADTNEQLGLLMHNKYVIVDGTSLFTGAGNFSKASLTGKNTEQFYVTTDPALLDAYVRGWTELRGWAKPKDYFTTAGDSTPGGGGGDDDGE
jgi:phosphatidylserine/phosphatidylglycerophosphate/cardiolipin synthase-like enzyme